MSLLVTFAFCQKDCDRLLDLLEWCGQLGRSWSKCLLVVDPDVTWPDGCKAIELAEKAFSAVEMVALDGHVEGWIPGSNALFKRAALEAKERHTAFLFIEPDAVPLKAGWVEAIADAYGRCGKPFMGAMVTHQQPGLPSPYLEGVAVYPANAIDVMDPAWKQDQSWTLATAGAVVPQAFNSPLFKHVWGQGKLPPTFAERNIPGTHVFSLQNIPPDAVLWHRCKDGSLIRLLRKRSGINVQSDKMLVAIPFCAKDGERFLNNVRWWAQLDGKVDYECLLSYENGTPENIVGTMTGICTGLFSKVHKHKYDKVPHRVNAPTWAFTRTARFVSNIWRGCWLWTEYDMIPMKPGWLDTLRTAYLDSGKSFGGPIVDGMGHMNGTGIYPWDTPTRIPKAMVDMTHAWDMAMKDEMIHDCVDLGKLLQHVWVTDRAGVFQPSGNGTCPSFGDDNQFMQLLPTAAVFHRCKDHSLIERLRNGRNIQTRIG